MSTRPQTATATDAPEILARGPWELAQVRVHWQPEQYEPSQAHIDAADAAIKGLRERGSPSHDGMAARLVDYRQDAGGQTLRDGRGWS